MIHGRLSYTAFSTTLTDTTNQHADATSCGGMSGSSAGRAQRVATAFTPITEWRGWRYI